MRHVGAIAGRELRSLFVSPVAYAVLALFAVLAGFFFLTAVLGFETQVAEATQFQAFDFLSQLNLNDHVLAPFYSVIWIFLLLLVPAITMGLFAAEKTNGTQELLMTSPITIWELVIGKFLAAAAFITLLIAIVAAFTGVLFLYGEPEVPKSLCGLLALLLVGLSYAAVGTFASSVTRNQLIAFLLSIVILLPIWMLAVVADLTGGAVGSTLVADGLRWLSPADRFQSMLTGLLDTEYLAYFGFMIGLFLILTKATVESVRWR